MPGAVYGELLALPNASPGGSPEGLQEMPHPSWAGMGCGTHVLTVPFLLPHSPNAEHRDGKSCIEVKDESKGTAWINTWAGNAGLAKGHSCSGRICFKAEPKLGAWRLHLTPHTQSSTCQTI